ncbi:hypothetical protein HanXRQr2_Chr15g0697941 [Helianthus annuus]|uniref:Uncharacterized protein n=1 Tax=Helianthus annuus TaxID=4232 RepID=A0A9K3E2Q9_HELAN|nr:hypothetical protein HanXRQr2_Chr15g0697941 [Helianthus annuus]KAJ0831662.1 hypothetical protein HanPSC8_Chr15g0669651 [Helianthus annuus]
MFALLLVPYSPVPCFWELYILSPFSVSINLVSSNPCFCELVVVLWEVFGKVVVVVVCGRGWQLARLVAIRDFLGLWDVILIGV